MSIFQLNTAIIAILRQQAALGPISFKNFMESALYTPNIGYYMRASLKIGRKADFVTAPTLGSLFARCLAEQLDEIFSSLPSRNFIEFGAGTGQLAATLGTLIDFTSYSIIEISPSLRAQQQQYIAQHHPTMLTKITWLENVPQNFIGVIFANEVLDAFAVHKFYYHHQQLFEYYVAFDHNQELSWQLGEPSPELQAEFTRQELAKILAQQDHYTSELNSAIQPWLTGLADKLQQGVILLCDYGFDRREYFHPMRNMGTLMAHYQQETSSDLLIRAGEQDLTAHVDFTSVAEVTLTTSLELLGYTNLTNFLLNCNILEHYQLTKQFDEFNILTAASEMGELFKVIALGQKLPEICLQGFKSLDYSHKL